MQFHVVLFDSDYDFCKQISILFINMAQNYRERGCTSSESEDSITIEEIIPGFKKRYQDTGPRLMLPYESNTLKRKLQVSDENSSDSQELFIVDHKRRKNCFNERSEKRNERSEKRNSFLNEGFYPCKVCDAYFKSYTVYECHLTDNSHIKAFRKSKLKAKRQSTEKETYPKLNGLVSDAMGSRYPTAPYGVIRRRVMDESAIQNVVETNFPACPGLEHVREIRALKETLYYCGICNLTLGSDKILSHLKKNKHLLYSLKAISPHEYQNLERLPRCERKNALRFLLHSYQEKDGIGRIIVEKDYLADNDTKEKKYSENFDAPGTSSGNRSMIYHEGDTFPPNSYFCYKCECSMFDNDMSESHYRGGKRIRNTTMASNLRVTPLPKSEAFLVDILNEKDEAVVGLDFIREFQHLEDKKETYHCFICGDCLTCLEITQHATSLTHRIKYIEYINHYSVDKVRSLDLSTNKAYYIVSEICRTIQRERGKGCPEVYRIKKSPETE